MQMIVRRAEPLNCEPPLSALEGGVVTASDRFYVRSHFPVPTLDVDRWSLRVFGLVRNQLNIPLQELHQMPSRTMTVTLECAGNGRSSMTPAIEGEQWDLGAVSTARWTGVPLAEVLGRAGIDAAAIEVVFRGADQAVVAGHAGSGRPRRFQRSLTSGDLRSIPVLLAYAMNGEALPPQHGYPLRAIVPSRYAVNSVKWLTQIEAVSTPFRGFFQSDRYVYQWLRNGSVITEPVGQIRVRSLITHPTQYAPVSVGTLAIHGFAWSGAAPIATVEVSIDDQRWQQAQLLGSPSRLRWQRWRLTAEIRRPGVVSIAARAADRAGNVQNEHAEWNRLGYGNNSIQVVSVRAAPRARTSLQGT
jgi:DMSO/TMAO reductase YedYZ molybdopterin-dependent catalytic subunit